MLETLKDLETFALERRRAAKAAGPVTSQNAGTATVLAGQKFRGLMDDTIAQSQWLRYGVHIVSVDPGTTIIPIRNFDGVRWRFLPAADEGNPNFDATVLPTDREVAFTPAHAAIEIRHTRTAQQRYKSLLGSDLRRSDEKGLATAFGNNLARAVIRGDVTSTDTSLNGITGFYNRAQAQGQTLDLSDNVGGVAVARPFDPDELFWRALQVMPVGLRTPRLRWYANPDLWIQWGRWLANSGTQERNRDEIAKKALIDGAVDGPIGRPGLSIPDWPNDDGPTAAANTAIDDGDQTLTIGVANVLPNVNSYAGRRVRVMYTPTQVSEDLAVVRTAGANLVETVGALGQVGALDVVPANYSAKVIDETSLAVADPFGVLLAMENVVRAYRTFNERSEATGLIVHADLDHRLLRPDAVVFVSGFYVPQFS